MDQLPDVEKPGRRVETQLNIAQAAQRFFSADFCAVQALNPITGKFYGLAVITGIDDYRDASVQSTLKAISEKAISQNSLYVESVSAEASPSAVTTEFEGITTIGAIVLHTQREQRPVAVLILGFKQPRKFSESDRGLFDLLVTQYSPILENIWLLGRYREVVRIGQEINQTLIEPRALFEHLYKKVSTILHTKYFLMLGVYHHENNTIDYHMAYRGELVSIEGCALGGGSAYVINNKAPIIEVNRSQNQHPRTEFVPIIDNAPPYPESLIFVPLIFRDEALGVLSIQQLEAGAYDREDLQIMTLLGNQVALAISDIRLFGYLESLNQIGWQLTSQLTSEEMLNDIVRRIKDATKADIVTLYPYVHNTDQVVEECFREPHTSGMLFAPEHVNYTVQDDDIAWLTLQKGEPIWATDSTQLFQLLGGNPKARKGYFEMREGVLSTAAMALRIEGVAVGALFVNYRHTQHFKAAQRNLILGLANFATVAINNNNRFIDLSKQRLTELEALRKIDQEISKSLKLKDVLEAILKYAADYVGGKDSSLFLFNPNTRELETEVSLGSSQHKYERLTMSVEGKGLVPWVYKNKRSARVGNVQTDPTFRDIYQNVVVETVSELDVPLIDQEEVIGVINFESSREDAFSKADETFLNILAGQAVLAIKNAQTYERAEAGERSREAYREVARQIIAQQDDYEKIIRVILREARKLIGAEIGIFQQYENGRAVDYYIEAESEEVQAALFDGIDRENISGILDHGILQHVAKSKQPYTTVGRDTEKDNLYKGSPHIHSEMAVPLLDEDNTLMGVMDIESLRPFAFGTDDERVLAMFGELSVIAFKNAHNYSRAKLESKRFKLLYEAGRELSKVTDPEQVEKAYEVVVKEVGEFSKGEVVIRRYDQATESLVVAKVERSRPSPPMESIPRSMGVNGQVARELRTIRIDDIRNPPEGVAEPIGDDPSVQALVVTPLLFESSYYGNLVLSHEQANSFAEDDINLLKGLARQLAITLHRLEAEQNARAHRVMSEVGQSAMEIAHRLGNWLKPVDLDINHIRKILQVAGIEHNEINAELDRVRQDVKSLLSMASGLRQKIAGLGPLERERSVVSIKELVLEAVDSLYKPENIEMRLEIEDDLPDVNVNPGQVIDILRNLLSNSAEVMLEGGVVTTRAFQPGKGEGSPSYYVLVAVEDTGPGIPLENQAKVFNLFFSTKRSSGFGLWSARQYARANGGDLTLRSVEGQGATFTLKLPVAPK